MKGMNLGLALVIFLSSCSKPPPEKPTTVYPKMTYLDFSDSAVFFDRNASFDLDGNGEKDIRFSTLFSADPLSQQDKRQWLAVCSFNTSLPVNTNENIPVLNLDDLIPINNFSGYSWYNAPGIVLSQKVTGMSAAPYWEGAWKDASHRFIPIQLKKNSLLYNGWVEVSFDKLQEKIILHKSAMSQEADKSVLAGK